MEFSIRNKTMAPDSNFWNKYEKSQRLFEKESYILLCKQEAYFKYDFIKGVYYG